MASRENDIRGDGDSLGFNLSGAGTGSSVVTVDYEKYEWFLESADLSEDQKRQFIDALWQIIVGFVDLGFGVHPAQQAEKACGKLRENRLNRPLTAENEVEYKSKLLNKNFEDAADPESDLAAGGFKT